MSDQESPAGSKYSAAEKPTVIGTRVTDGSDTPQAKAGSIPAGGAESPAGSAGLVADIDSFLLLGPLNPKFSSDAILPVLQRARDRIVELKSSGDAVEISTLLALKSQFTAQQERITSLEAQLAAAQAAPREPTEVMIAAAMNYLPGKLGAMQWKHLLRAVYDAALASPSGSGT